jgi:transaldolase
VNALQRLYMEQAQSPWIDFIDRALIDTGKLEALRRQGLRGLTSNPTIFAKAVGSGQYDDLVRRMSDEGADTWTIYEQIAVDTCGRAADMLRPIYDEAPESGDGCVSIEVEPQFAHDTARTLERVRHLWGRLNRPNVFVKIPATAEGLPAIEQAISEGININVTLMFSVDVYRSVAQAYIAGLQRRADAGQHLDGVISVASFFVSRVDSKIDKVLDAEKVVRARELRGKAAIANAKLAYAAFGETFGGLAFAALGQGGARMQRCLWASTSVKNPEYRDVMYVEELIGPDTVNTMPLDTIEAFLDHGRVERTLDRDLNDARRIIEDLEAHGIAMSAVSRELLTEGVEAFGKSFDELIGAIESKRRALAHA